MSDFLPGGALSREKQADNGKTWLIGQDRAALSELVADLGEPAFRAKQLYHWIYHRGARDFESMTNVSKTLRAKLSEIASLDRPAATSHQVSEDGTRKWLFRFADGNEAETVFIPDADRGTLCVSSQVGCTLTCTFCHTGTQRMVRNLTAGEIVAQLMVARDTLGDWNLPGDERRLTNVVFMGMGEPLYNTDNVIAAINLMTDGDGISLSRRRVTVSTSGVVPDIEKVGAETGALLAISLHAVRDELRDVLVPINRKFPLKTLLQAVRAYPGLGNAKRVTWEYVMLKGVNDSIADAKALVQLIKGIPSKINLIPFNPWPGTDYDCSDDETIEKFAQVVWDAGYSAPIRTPRGRDILAACGQLKSASERASKSRRSDSSSASA
ncbi:MAG: 23S rRNA (adenine(2503)-C(2))-methyltransferase RlmN [Alphaproteobacteria bacterium]